MSAPDSHVAESYQLGYRLGWDAGARVASEAAAARVAELEAALAVCDAYYDGTGRTSDRDVKAAIARAKGKA